MQRAAGAAGPKQKRARRVGGGDRRAEGQRGGQEDGVRGWGAAGLGLRAVGVGCVFTGSFSRETNSSPRAPWQR